jgi:hypothetical protein
VDVEELREKFVILEQLRDARALDPSGDVPREELRALALRFPGALREIERLPREVLRARREALDGVLRGESEPRWAVAQRIFHAELRGALTVKRLLGRRLRSTDELARDLVGRAFADDAARWVTRIDELLKPPSGRIEPLVVAEVARTLGVTLAECRGLLFPWLE